MPKNDADALSIVTDELAAPLVPDVWALDWEADDPKVLIVDTYCEIVLDESTRGIVELDRIE